MIKMLSLDTSTSCSGWAYWKNAQLKKYGYEYSGKQGLEDMLIKLYNLISKYKPDIIVIEDPPMTNTNTIKKLSKVLGAVQGYCSLFNIEYHELNPSKWRKLISEEKKPRKRAELKQWGINKVKTLYGIKVEIDDVSDAILIGQAYINMYDNISKRKG